MKIRYIGELLEHTGYGEAARQNIVLLTKMGHDVEAISPGAQTSNDTDWKVQTVLRCMQTKHEKPDLIITHIYPPQAIAKYKQKGVPLVAYLAWEVDMLSSIWAYHLNKNADYIITTCTEMKKVFERSGVQKPVFVLGPTIFHKDISIVNSAPVTSEELPVGFRKIYDRNKFIFYGVFQWVERKDPRKLVAAFIQEFDMMEDVMLLIKSYRVNYSEDETKRMVGSVNMLNREMNIIYPPEVRIIPNRLSQTEMTMLHRMCDCYVSPHRGEGTGLGIIDAIMHKNPTIITPYGGPTDFTTPESTRWLKYKMVPIQNPLYCHNYFNAYMMWADADIMHLRRCMRQIYENHKPWSQEKAYKAKKYLINQYRMEKNAERMTAVIENL